MVKNLIKLEFYYYIIETRKIDTEVYFISQIATNLGIGEVCKSLCYGGSSFQTYDW